MNKKIAVTIFAVLLLLVGIVWTLQGASILPGSYMTGQPEWFVAGVACMTGAAALLRYTRRMG